MTGMAGDPAKRRNAATITNWFIPAYVPQPTQMPPWLQVMSCMRVEGGLALDEILREPGKTEPTHPDGRPCIMHRPASRQVHRLTYRNSRFIAYYSTTNLTLSQHPLCTIINDAPRLLPTPCEPA